MSSSEDLNHVLNKETSAWSAVGVDKWALMIGLTLASMFFGLLPYLVIAHSRSISLKQSLLQQLTLEVLSCFSGGVLLATTLLHILPEVSEKERQFAKELHDKHNNHDNDHDHDHAHDDGHGPNPDQDHGHAPSAELLTLYGFCMMYLIEEVVNLFLNFPTKCGAPEEHTHGCGESLEDEFDGCCCDGGRVRNGCQHATLMRPLTDMKGSSCSLHLDESPTEGPVKDPLSISVEGSKMHKSVSRFSLVTSASTIHCLISVLALSFHAIMEGIAVGVRESADMWMTFGAIASHKLIIAFSLGVEFIRSNGSFKSAFFSLFLFAIVTPIGIVLGSIASSDTYEDSRWPVVIQGMTVGTLLYVIFFEIFPPAHDHGHNSEEESSSHRHPLWFQGPLKFLGTLLGITVAACLLNTLHIPHSHGHSHGHD